MTKPLPVYCGRGGYQHAAAYEVQGPGRAEVVCEEHLAASKKWAGHGATATPLPGHDPPPEQLALL
jgi:hypothetical protein